MNMIVIAATMTFLLGQGEASPPPQAEKKWAELHPALRVDGPTALSIFEKGFADAKKARTSQGQWDRVRRGIGSIRINTIGQKETVSWLWAKIPQIVIYEDGFKAKKQYRSDEDIAKSKELHGSGTWTTLDIIRFDGSIGLYPSFGRTYGRIDRQADPSDLKDVRVVMQVGDKIYQPRKHPGTLEPQAGSSTNDVSIPQTSTTTAQASAYGSGGYAYGTARATSYYVIHKAEFYNWYEGVFSVDFDLFNEDGSARIKATDKEIKLIVVYGPNERGAVYKLDEFNKIGR